MSKLMPSNYSTNTGYFTPRVRASNYSSLPLRAGSLTASIRVQVERAKDTQQPHEAVPAVSHNLAASAAVKT